MAPRLTPAGSPHILRAPSRPPGSVGTGARPRGRARLQRPAAAPQRGPAAGEQQTTTTWRPPPLSPPLSPPPRCMPGRRRTGPAPAGEGRRGGEGGGRRGLVSPAPCAHAPRSLPSAQQAGWRGRECACAEGSGGGSGRGGVRMRSAGGGAGGGRWVSWRPRGAQGAWSVGRAEGMRLGGCCSSPRTRLCGIRACSGCVGQR